MPYFQEVQFRDDDNLEQVKRKLRTLVEEVSRIAKKSGGGSFSGSASDVSYNGSTVQIALESLAAADADLQAQIDAILVGEIQWDDIQNKPLTFPPSAHTHPATEVDYSGATSGLIASNVQAAIDETVLLIGTGGISDLDDIPGVVLSSVTTGDVLTWDGANWINAAPGGGSYTDEEAQDAVGTILVDSATIDFTYNDATPSITASVNASATLDVIGSTRGQILYRGASAWSVLSPGTAGYVLSTNGAGADPSWIAAASGSSANITPDTHPSSANVANDEFEVGSSIDTAGTRFSGATPWTWRNQGAATGTIGSQGSLVLFITAAAGDNLRIVEQPISGACKYQAKVAVIELADFSAGGMCLINSGTGKVMTLASAGNGGPKHQVAKYTNVTTFSTAAYNTADTALYGATHQFVYFEIEYDGTNVFFRISGSGVTGSFLTLFSETAATFLGTPDRIGLFVNSNNASNALVTVCDWFRRIS